MRIDLHGSSQIRKADGDALRYMTIVTSNAYRDREEEIVSQKALEGYVDSCWKGDRFVGTNPLLVWHGGEPIGDIVYSEMVGPFLLEVAKERPNAVVNLALRGEEPRYAEIKSVWDSMEQEPDLGASHEFYFNQRDREDGVYDEIKKTETSVLPRIAAANFFTEAQIVGGKA